VYAKDIFKCFGLEQDLDCLMSLKSCLESLSVQDDLCKCASSVLLSALLELHSLKMQASSDENNENDYLKLLFENTGFTKNQEVMK